MHQYNLKHVDTPELPPNNPPVLSFPHRPPQQKHKHLLPTIKIMGFTTLQPYINTLDSTPEVALTPS